MFGPKFILWGHWLPLFWTSCDLPYGFQSQSGSLACTLTCLCMVNLRAMSGTTSAFSTNRGVHCISVYTADWPSRHPSCKQQRVGSGGLLTLGSSEIRSRACPLKKWMCYPLGSPTGVSSIFLLFNRFLPNRNLSWILISLLSYAVADPGGPRGPRLPQPPFLRHQIIFWGPNCTFLHSNNRKIFKIKFVSLRSAYYFNSQLTYFD